MTDSSDTPNIEDSMSNIDSELDFVKDSVWQTVMGVQKGKLLPKEVDLDIADLQENIRQLIARERQKAVEDTVVKIMSAKTEGLFDNGDLFIKRAPIEQVIINLIGFEKFKAIQDAVSAAQSKESK